MDNGPTFASRAMSLDGNSLSGGSYDGVLDRSNGGGAGTPERKRNSRKQEAPTRVEASAVLARKKSKREGGDGDAMARRDNSMRSIGSVSQSGQDRGQGTHGITESLLTSTSVPLFTSIATPTPVTVTTTSDAVPSNVISGTLLTPPSSITHQKSIPSVFKSFMQPQQQVSLPVTVTGSSPGGTSNTIDHSSVISGLEATITKLRAELATAQAKLSSAVKDCEQLRASEGELRQSLDDTRKALEQQATRSCGSGDVPLQCSRIEPMADIVRELQIQANASARKDLCDKMYRLGKYTYKRHSFGGCDVWEDGVAYQALAREEEALTKRKNDLSAMKQRTTKALKKAGVGSGGAGGSSELATDVEALVQDETVKAQLSEVKKQEAVLAQRREALDAEKAVLILEMRRCRDEDESIALNKLPLLAKRYLPLQLLGKGGFSEVWKVVDLQEGKYAAAKIHRMLETWSNAELEHFVKHITREYAVQRALNHPNVVRLTDVFEINKHVMATVLEHCSGGDLDHMIKEHGYLKEAEARGILVQIMSALMYLHEQTPTIVHYDLKPANILFSEVGGSVKVTDFGLSKVFERSDEGDGLTSMALTSQGAGTYYYLPPESFERGPGARVSHKADVWSLGVVYYEMLYGKRPFGEGKTQQAIMQEQIIQKVAATGITFPDKPVVSEDAKAFIRRCLTPDPRTRPEVVTLFNDPYFRAKVKGGK